MRAGDLSPIRTGVVDTIGAGDSKVEIIWVVPVHAGNDNEYMVRFKGKGITYHKRFKRHENARLFAIQIAMGGTP